MEDISNSYVDLFWTHNKLDWDVFAEYLFYKKIPLTLRKTKKQRLIKKWGNRYGWAEVLDKIVRLPLDAQKPLKAKDKRIAMVFETEPVNTRNAPLMIPRLKSNIPAFTDDFTTAPTFETVKVTFPKMAYTHFMTVDEWPLVRQLHYKDIGIAVKKSMDTELRKIGNQYQ